MELVCDTKKASEFIGCKPPLMQRWRRERKGPPYMKIGRLVRYRQRDLEEFLEQNLRKPEAK